MDDFKEIIKKLAETYYNNPEEFINKLNNSYGIKSFLEAGAILYNFSYYWLAVEVWEKALGYFLKGKNRIGESSCYTNLGAVYDSLGKYSEAIRYLNKSLKIAQNMNDRPGEAKSLLLGAFCVGWGLGVRLKQI